MSQRLPAPNNDTHTHIHRWDDDVFVSRAPGRLDVMGGIADYSGALVLQVGLTEFDQGLTQSNWLHAL